MRIKKRMQIIIYVTFAMHSTFASLSINTQRYEKSDE